MKIPQNTITYLYILEFNDLPPKCTEIDIGIYHMISPNSCPIKKSISPMGFKKLILKLTMKPNPTTAHQNSQKGFERVTKIPPMKLFPLNRL